MTVVNGNAKMYVYYHYSCFSKLKINTKMIHYCYSNGNNFLSMRRCRSYFDGSAPFFSRFHTISFTPKMRFQTGAWCESAHLCLQRYVTFSNLFRKPHTAVKSLAVQRILMRDACLDGFMF